MQVGLGAYLGPRELMISILMFEASWGGGTIHPYTDPSVQLHKVAYLETY